MAKDADEGNPTEASQSTNVGESTENEVAGGPGRSEETTGHPQPLQAADYVRKGTWHNLVKWECKLCPWDTLEGEDVAIAHVVDRHMPREPRTPVLNLPRFNRFGEEVKKADG